MVDHPRHHCGENRTAEPPKPSVFVRIVVKQCPQRPTPSDCTSIIRREKFGRVLDPYLSL
jgi:hypothetical protein